MHRILSSVVFAYAGLAAAQWGRATRWLHVPAGTHWCSNVISDPFGGLLNIVVPVAALCSLGIARRCLRRRRWPGHAIVALLTFAVTSACLGYEAHVLGDYGLEIGWVWWLPWR